MSHRLSCINWFERLSIVLLVLIVGFTLTSGFGLEVKAQASNFKIVIDPGHGSGDHGASGPTGLPEKDVNLAIGLKLRGYLQNSGVTVLMTRDSDTYPSLEERANLANSAGAHLFVAIHHNSSAPQVNGTETYIYTNASSTNRDLANKVQSSLVSSLGLPNRGVKTADFYVLRSTNMPSLLTEASFISNPQEEQRLKSSSYQDREAQAIYQAIMTYVSSAVTLQGRGRGHGVGASMAGVYGMANAGYGYASILQHYYTGIAWGSRPDDQSVWIHCDKHNTDHWISVREYLYRLTEEPDSWPREGLRTLMVAARSYLWYKLNTNGGRMPGGQAWDCEINPSARPNTVAAVNDTGGQVLTYSGNPICAAYSGNSGGYTANYTDIWGGSGFPYLKAVPSPYDSVDSRQGVYQWTVTLPAATIEAAYPSIGKFSNLQVLSRNGCGEWGGRILSVKIVGTGGSVTVGGWEFRNKFGLNSSWFTTTANYIIPHYWHGWDIANDMALSPFSGHYVLDGWGGVHGHSTLSYDAYWGGQDLARGIVSLPNGTGYYILDSWGGIQTCGTAIHYGNPYWAGTDTARDIDVMPDGAGYYILDAYGGVHAQGSAVYRGSPYWADWDIARAISVKPNDGSGYYVLDGLGGVHSQGNATDYGHPYWDGKEYATDITVTTSGDGYYVLDGFGGVHTYGNVVNYGNPYWPGQSDMAQRIITTSTGKGYYIVDRLGGLHAYGDALRLSGSNWPQGGIARGIARNSNSTVYALDSCGKVYVYGAPFFGNPYWEKRDLARSIAPTSTGLGYYVLDGFGGLHVRGDAQYYGSPYFGIDVAQTLALTPDGGGYYVLDGFGGVHAFGNAVGRGSPYWPGASIARDIAITPDGGGYYVLDGFGGVHAFGNAVKQGSPYWPGWDIARDMAITPGGGYYVLDGFGGVHTFGNATSYGSPSFGRDLARKIIVTPTGQGYYILDGWGGIHAFGDATSEPNY